MRQEDLYSGENNQIPYFFLTYWFCNCSSTSWNLTKGPYFLVIYWYKINISVDVTAVSGLSNFMHFVWISCIFFQTSIHTYCQILNITHKFSSKLTKFRCITWSSTIFHVHFLCASPFLMFIFCVQPTHFYFLRIIKIAKVYMKYQEVSFNALKLKFIEPSINRVWCLQ